MRIDTRVPWYSRLFGVPLVAGSIYVFYQYCPVNLRGLGQKANSGGAFRVTWGVSDLNRKWSFALAFRVFATPESPCISARPCSHRPWDFLPWKTFHRIVNRYGGDHRTRSLSCAEQFRVMAFAQLVAAHHL